MAVPYYLPIARKAFSSYVRARELPAAPIERAALFVALLQLQGQGPSAGLGMLLSQALALFAADPEAGGNALLSGHAALASHDTPALLATLADAGVLLAPQERMDARVWADAQGRYTDHFQDQCRALLEDYQVGFADGPDTVADGDGDPQQAPRRQVTLHGTRDQEVAARVIAAGEGEHIAIDAYAGTGKTFLVHALDTHLRGGFTYIAPTRAHLHGFRQHSGAAQASGLRVMTIWELGHALAKSHAQLHGLTSAPRVASAAYPPERQAEVAGIAGHGRLSAGSMQRLAAKGLAAWCHSEDPRVEARHFRRVWVPQDVPLETLVQAARRLWTAMFQRHALPGHVFDLSLDHLAKWLALQGAAIPAGYGTLLVDEAHDLSPAWRYLLEAYAGGCVLMGDPHQRLRGHMPRSARAKHVAMATSVRTGVGSERLIEGTLQLAPERGIQVPFQASGAHVTRCHSHADGEVPAATGLHLHGSEWALLERALRLKDAGAAYAFLPASRIWLERSVRRALALHRGDTLAPGERVSGCDRWDALATRLHAQGQQRILRLFERGFGERELMALFAAADAQGNGCVLGLLDHAKNLEADVVALAPCCFGDAAGLRGFQPVHAAYLGMTRARHALWVPGDALDRLVSLAVD